MPFRSGNQGQAGEIAEIIVYTSELSDANRRSIETWLADRYLLPVPPLAIGSNQTLLLGVSENR